MHERVCVSEKTARKCEIVCVREREFVLGACVRNSVSV